MKKLLMLSAVAMVAGSSFAVAQGPEGAPPEGKGPREGVPEKRIEMILKSHDLNGDNTITEDEFLKEAKERFAKMDLNSDGKVTKKELEEKAKEMMKKFKEMREERGEKGKNPPPPPPAEEK